MSKTSENQTSTADEKSDINRDFFLVLNGDENSHQNKKAKEKDENVCNFCQKNLSSNCTLRRHMKIYHSSKISLPVYCCDHCDLKFIKKGSLISHLKSKHQKGKEIKFECDFDGKIFDSKAKIYKHMKACHRTIKECNLCGKKVQVLNQHMRQVHATEDEKVQCQICNKTCKNQKTLKIHLKIHNKQHQCQICGRKFSNSAQLKIHLIFHKNQFAFRCEICQKNFTSPSNFRTHLKTHEKKRIKNLKCKQCQYSTDVKRNFENHVKNHNKNREKNLKCNQCDYKTDQKGSLKNHMQNHNPNRKKFPCLYCNYEATQRGSLNKHLKAKHDPNRNKKF